MDEKNIVSELKVQLNEINRKVDEIRGKVSEKKNEEIKVQASAMLEKMEDLKNEITAEYNKLERAEEKQQDNVPEADKNIYNSINSFNDAFTEAGKMFKTR